MNSDRVLMVVVEMITYNHEKFIAQAIESVLAQKTNFWFKIIICEDCSTDRTGEICREFKSKFPNIIDLHLNERNEGVTLNARKLHLASVHSNSKYIAQCEGDDYWNDPFKLQFQIDFLEGNPSYVGVFHNTEERYEDNDDQASFLYCNFPVARDISFADLSFSNLIPTCSAVFRNGSRALPEWFYRVKMGDWPRHLLNAKDGNYRYVPKIMGVHRLHNKSMWALQNDERNNEYIYQAYDTMMNAFIDDPEKMNLLAEGKQLFVSSLASYKKKSLKERAKHFAINAIRKL